MVLTQEKKGWLGTMYLVAIIVTGVFVVLRAWDPPPLQVLRLKLFDFYQQVRPRLSTSQPVVIVDIDDQSLAAYGQWPWPRTRLAELTEKLFAHGAVAIGFDIVFAEPDRSSLDVVADTATGIDDDTRRLLKSFPRNDVVFGESLAAGRVVLGQAMTPQAMPDTDLTGSRKSAIGQFGGDPRPFLLEFGGIIRNIPELESKAVGIGFFTVEPEFDNIIRRLPTFLRVQDEIYPSLGLEMLRVATGQTAFVIKSNKAGLTSVVVSGVEIPTDQNGRTWVHFNRYDSSRYISAKDVLDGSVPPSRLKGRLILVGTSAAGLHDIKSTPIDEAVPGVEIHAQWLETVLSGSYLHRPNYALVVELAITVALCLMLAIMVPLVGPVGSLALGGGGVASTFAVSWYSYVQNGVLLGVAYPAVAGFVLYSILIFMNYVREGAHRRELRDTFGHYVSPALVEQLVANPEKVKLGGEMKDLTILFGDIRNFTTICERYKFDPEGLTRLLNRFLTPMTDFVLDQRGTIDKYIGDCIMAFWNAPLDDADHVRNACSAALAMQQGVVAFNCDPERETDNPEQIPLKLGIGINTGPCCVGNMGSAQRFDYSVIGDAVNLASRLEGQSKVYGVDIIISENTYGMASDFAALELDFVRVKGKEEVVRIFALLGGPDLRDSGEFATLVSRHQEMLEAYRAQDWAKARSLVGACRTCASNLARLYDLYDGRIDEYEKTPPEPDWGGIFVAT